MARTEASDVLREHPEYVGYFARADGTIWSFWTKKGCARGQRRIDYEIEPRMMKPAKFGNGYRQAKITADGRWFGILVHRFVLECFVGQKPFGMECRHLNGKKFDNAISNICWGTRTENSADRKFQGTHRNKLDPDAVLKIKKELRAGLLPREIAPRYGVSRVMINQIRLGHQWAHVGGV